MSEKEVGIKISIKGGSWKNGLRQLEDETKASGNRMSSALGNVGKSLKAGLGGLRSSLGPIMEIGGIGAALGVGALVTDSMKVEQKLRNLSFVMSKTAGATYNYAGIQKVASDITKKWGVSTDDIADAMGNVFKEVGDAKVATQSLDAIAMTSRATGVSMDELSKIAGSMNEQFGVKPEEMGAGLASIIDMTSKGGVKIEEVSGSMDKLGQVSKRAGITGADGMRKALALANALEDSAGGGAQAIESLSGVLGKLDAGKAQRKAIAAMGIQTTDASGKELNGVDLLKSIMDKTKGDVTQLGKIFRPEQAEMLSQSLGGGKFDDAMKKAGDAAISEADTRKQAEEMMQTSAVRFEAALNTIRDMFASPQVIAAIGKFADNLPRLADGIVSIIGLVADHPYAAGGALLAKNMLPGMLGGGGGGGGGGLLGGGGGPGGINPLQAAVAVPTAAITGYLTGQALHDYLVKQDQAREQVGRDAEIGGENDLSASRSGSFSMSERASLAARATKEADALQGKIDLGLARQSGDTMRFNDLLRERAEKALPNGSIGERNEWIDVEADKARDYQSNLAELMAGRDSKRQAAANFGDPLYKSDEGVLDSLAGDRGRGDAFEASRGFMGGLPRKGRRGLVGALGTIGRSTTGFDEMIDALGPDTGGSFDAAVKKKGAEMGGGGSNPGAQQAQLLSEMLQVSSAMNRKVQGGLSVKIDNAADIAAAFNGALPGHAKHD